MLVRSPLISATAALAVGVSAPTSAVGLFCGPAVADAPPTIPYARAYITHRDDVQTMVVDAAIYAPEGRYAWIIAVPAKPDVARISDGDPLGALVESMPPAVGPDDSRRWRWATVAAVFGFGLCLSAPWRLKGGSRSNLARLAVEGAVAAIVVSGAWVAGGFGMGREIVRPATSPIRDVPQNLNRTLRPANVEIFEATSPGDLSAWFRKHGVAPTRDARPVLDAAIRQGSWFVALPPSRHDGRAQMSAPVEIVFPTAQPRLPLRLTGAGQRSDLVLDVFVFGDRPARADRAERWAVYPDPEGESGGLAMQRDSGLPVAGGTLTRLRARLPSEFARRDMTIAWETAPVRSPGPIRRESQVRSRAWFLSALAAWGVAFVGVGIGFRRGWTPMPMVGWLLFLTVPVFLASYRHETFTATWVDLEPAGRTERPVPRS